MENASKALIIAGAVLLAIILLSMLVMFFGDLRKFADTDSSIKEGLSTAEFNQQFNVYERNVYGTELFSLANKIKDYNPLAYENGYEEIELVVRFNGTFDETLKKAKIFELKKYGVKAEHKADTEFSGQNADEVNIVAEFERIDIILNGEDGRSGLSKKKYTGRVNDITYTRTIEQLANMRTNELNDYGFTKEAMDPGKYEKMLSEMNLYAICKSSITKIKEMPFKFDYSEVSPTTGRIIKMVFSREF